LTAQANIFAFLNAQQKEFIDFLLSKYIESGVEELDQEKLAGTELGNLFFDVKGAT
jgi:type I restriction enzyme R subunit